MLPAAAPRARVLVELVGPPSSHQEPGLDGASCHASFPDDGLPSSLGGGPPEPGEGQPAEQPAEEPSDKARISALLEGIM